MVREAAVQGACGSQAGRHLEWTTGGTFALMFVAGWPKKLRMTFDG
jgi:hypothetical protein